MERKEKKEQYRRKMEGYTFTLSDQAYVFLKNKITTVPRSI